MELKTGCTCTFPPKSAQKRIHFQPAQHQAGVDYTCISWAVNAAGPGQRSAPFRYIAPG